MTPPNLSLRRTRLTCRHINADEPRVLDYNQAYKSAGQMGSLYDDDACRSSDHDAVIVGLELETEPPAWRGLPLLMRTWEAAEEPLLRKRIGQTPRLCPAGGPDH